MLFFNWVVNQKSIAWPLMLKTVTVFGRDWSMNNPHDACPGSTFGRRRADLFLCFIHRQNQAIHI